MFETKTPHGIATLTPVAFCGAILAPEAGFTLRTEPIDPVAFHTSVKYTFHIALIAEIARCACVALSVRFIAIWCTIRMTLVLTVSSPCTASTVAACSVFTVTLPSAVCTAPVFAGFSPIPILTLRAVALSYVAYAAMFVTCHVAVNVPLSILAFKTVTGVLAAVVLVTGVFTCLFTVFAPVPNVTPNAITGCYMAARLSTVEVTFFLTVVSPETNLASCTPIAVPIEIDAWCSVIAVFAPESRVTLGTRGCKPVTLPTSWNK